MKTSNEILRATLQLTETMVELADLGDGARQDVGCGVLYGLVRDAAYKIRKAALQEKEEHIRKGIWPDGDITAQAKINSRFPASCDEKK